MQLYTEYPKAWDAILNDCRNAQKHIYIEHFIVQDFEEGQIGYRLTEILKDKAREGVKIKLLLDAVGSYPFLLNIPLQNELEELGIEIEFFDVVPRWRAFFPFNMFHRDHRKIVLVDDMIAHVGGVIFRESAHSWHDINVELDDQNYIQEIKGAFLRMWDEARGTENHKNEYGKRNGLVLKNDPEKNELYQEILKRVKNATKRVAIITPYLSPNTDMFKALKNAAARGVEVSITIPEEGDAFVSTIVNLSYLSELHKNKIKVNSYCECMNHGKLVMIDDWVTVGSMNFDRLSFFYNRELNLVFDNVCTKEFESLVEKVATCCKNVDEHYLGKQTLMKKFLGKVGILFRVVA